MTLNAQEHQDNSAVTVKSSKRKRAKRKRGQQWAFYVDSFKRTVDCLYEICRSDHNINGCKEAIIYLENSKRDFESLINTIKVETSWDESGRPQAVAWEIRKTTRSPVQISLESMPLAGILLQKGEAGSPDEEDDDFKEAMRLSLDDGWQLVAPRRRRSTSSSGDVAPSIEDRANDIPLQQPEAEQPRPNVYDRLSAPRRTISPSVSNATPSSPRPCTARASVGLQSARLTCPRSAMDLPQTKASMAKMAYSRQLLWERNQSLLAEKLRAKQRMERVDRQRRRGPSRCGIHFAERSTPQKNGSSFRQRLQCDSAPASERNPSVDRSLQSINEVGECDELETVPADPTPTSANRDNVIFSSTRSEPAFGEVSSLLGLDDDVEWREMTEEEESLALEEHSLNLEIEHEESFSIDIELERQVAAEAEALEKFELSQKASFLANKGKASDDNKSPNIGTSVDRNRDENRRRPFLTWSEVVGKESPYLEPGTVAERHEKMSSPGRMRCDKNDGDFSSRHAEKLRRATELRAQLQAEKTARLRELARRVEEVREKRQKVIERKRQLLESRMERAQENREKNITEIVRKAKDDEQKVLEVQFINSLQGGNMLLDLRMRDAGVEERKQTMAEERARRMEEKAAKEHAAEERRKLAELERIARLQEIAERKEARHAQLAAQRNEQERLRSEKRKQQQEKLTELRLADAEENESLRKRIQEKIESSSRRHEQNLEDVRVRAQEFSSPRPASGCRLTWSLVDSNLWPSDVQGTVFKCVSCNSEANTELEAVAHVMSKSHLLKMDVNHQTVSTEELEKEFHALIQSPASQSSEQILDDDPIWRKKRLKVKQRLAARNKKVGDVTGKPPASNTRQAKCVRDLVAIVSKCQQKHNRLEDSILQSLERNVTDVLREYESQEWLLTNFSTASCSSLVPETLTLLMKWTTTGATVRLLGKLSSMLCNLCSVASLCRTLLFTPLLVELMDNVILLLKKTERDSQLFCLMDVLLAAIRCVRRAEQWLEFGIDSHELEIRISMVASYLLVRQMPSILDSVVSLSVPRSLFSTLNSLHMELAGVSSEDTATIATSYCGLLLKTSILSLRYHSASMENEESESGTSPSSQDFVETTVRMCDSLSKDSRSWTMMLEDECFSFRMLLLLGHMIRSEEKSTSTSPLTPLTLNLIARYAAFDNYHQAHVLQPWWATSLFLPALIAMTYDNKSASQLLLEEMSEKHLVSFITEVKKAKPGKAEALQILYPNTSLDNLLRFYEELH
ncbi:hypothetical protein Q1695_009677 [Nippostrongylus brasiliensis]|nr:hypothetical protein Q1695_009677 [Nippostrongylus brasiliensis]